ncbi:MAG: L-serine ammonia-lyase, iron-sulfur-dependent subunit beta [bacterium]|nr:L-serine ammonia-lyase, iron-sulfur-dependent subunit beta [bacterium]
MAAISVFDVIGPNMIGPSSSHTAGAAAIALLTRKLMDGHITSVRFTLYGSFAETYRGHGTDKALLGGILGYTADDVRIRSSMENAEKEGLAYEFVMNSEEKTKHPNTVDIELQNDAGRTLSVRGESVGGGKIRLVRINRIEVDFTGEYSSLIVSHEDHPGVIAYITKCLADHKVNIAFMKLYREAKGQKAYTIVEADEKIQQTIIDEIGKNQYVRRTMLVQV